MLLWNTNNPGKSSFAAPYDSSYGMPIWTYIVAIGILFFIIVKVWLALKKDGKYVKRKKHNRLINKQIHSLKSSKIDKNPN